MQQYYVYILTSFKNTVLYTGVTNNLIRRVYEHKNNLVKGFTEKYHVHKLVYYEIFQDPENAIKREKAVKNLLRIKKIALIKANNSDFLDLYKTIL
ncbi:MAG: GIY-YIG nuclease family protein [Candidatus Daviesbacteria bacterium]|nr:GIY-YIG nuclease family protein [Candidatus Daviesbacteria bacterium]